MCMKRMGLFLVCAHWLRDGLIQTEADSNPRVFSTSFRMTPPTWRSEATLMVTGGTSDPKSSTVTDRSHADILGERMREKQGIGLTD